MFQPVSTCSKPAPRDRRRWQVCTSCGALFAARPGDHVGAIYCVECLELPDEPVTAEHYWDLGGGD